MLAQFDLYQCFGEPRDELFIAVHPERPVMTTTTVGPWRPLLARCVPMVLYLAFLAFTASLGTSLDLRWLYALQILLVGAALAFFARDYVELAEVRPLARADWLWALLIGAGVWLLWINLDGGWLRIGEAKLAFIPIGAEGQLIWPLIVVRIFGAALVVPVMEELFWRSLIMRWIDRSDFLALAPAAVSWRALLASSLVFGLEHGQWLAGIVAGLAYGYLYRRSGSLWPPILAHGLTNLLLGVWVVGHAQWQFW
jgi:CAAX prenyl protease-like protein